MYIALDVETGGLFSDSSLLQAYFGLYNKLGSSFTLIDELELNIKPDDGVYKVNAESLKLTGIDLIKHDKIAIPYTEASLLLDKKLKYWNNNGYKKLIPIGHCIAYDINKLTSTLLTRSVWETYVHYKVVDTAAIVEYLKLQFKLDMDINSSLGYLANMFNVLPDAKEALHNAKIDTHTTVKLLEKLIKL